MRSRTGDAPAPGGAWIWILCLSQVPIMLVYANYAAALPLLKAEWGLTNAEAGAIYTSFFIGYVVFSAVLSTATDYVSARSIFLGSAAWLGLTNLLFPYFAEGMWSAVFLRALTGVGLAGTYAPGLRIVAEYSPRERRARAVSIYAFFYTAGIAASMYVTGFLVARTGWRAAFALGSLGPALGIALAALSLPKLPRPAAAGGRRFEVPRLRLPVWVEIGVYVMHRWEVFGFRGWVVAFLASALMASGATGRAAAVDRAAAAAAAIIAAGSFSNLIGGWCADRYGRLPSVVGSLVLSGAIALTAGKAYALSYPALVGLCLVWVLMMQIDAPVLMVVVSEIAPARHLGSALGLQSGLGFLLGSLAPVAMGAILDLTNPAGGAEALPVHWGLAFASLGAAALVGAAGGVWLMRYLPGREGESGGAPPPPSGGERLEGGRPPW